MRIFDNTKGMYRKARPISFEYSKKDDRAMRIQIVNLAIYQDEWLEFEAIWNEELRTWCI